jgi:hypothetical protein
MPQDQAPAVLAGPGVEVSDPRELLLGYLEWYREALMRKIAGLPDERLRTPVEPLGWSPLGLVQHLGWVERRWMRWGFAAEQVQAYTRPEVTRPNGACLTSGRPPTSWPATGTR